MIYYSVLNNLTTQMSVVILSEKREDNSRKGKKIVTMVCFSAVFFCIRGKGRLCSKGSALYPPLFYCVYACIYWTSIKAKYWVVSLLYMGAQLLICVYVKNMLRVYQSLLMVVLHFEDFHIHSTYSFTPSKLFILRNVFIAL